MKTEIEILYEFYVLSDDVFPTGIRYGTKAPIWFGLALHDLGADVGRQANYSDESAHHILRYLLVQRNAYERWSGAGPPMTDAQRERAARALCLLRKINPDQRVRHSSPGDPQSLVLTYSYAWEIAQNEIAAHELIEMAMGTGRAYAA